MAKLGNSAGAGLGGDQVQSLLIDVRASTQGFSEDIAAMRGTFDSTLVEGFSRAGNVLEKGLLGAIRRGSLGFDDLKRVALDTMGQIAAQSIGGGLLGGLGSLVGSILGLPGRATGGTVSPGRGYLVGERGPELFIPTSAGRVESNAAARGGAREVRVSINVVTPQRSGAPQALQRSTRQVASAVRRALTSS
jgi:phage-related minor tail protein